MALSLDVVNVKGEKIDSVQLSEKVFEAKASSALIHEVINAYLANRRRGTHSTKTRGEVSGGGAKPWKQKHTGNARAGSSRSPLWRHGGIIFGPKPRDYNQPVSLTKRKIALRKILSDYAKEGRLRVVDSFTVSEAKTKRVLEIVKKLGIAEKTIIVLDNVSDTLQRASRNLAGVRICRVSDINSYNALQAEHLVFSKPALEQITQRLEN